MLYSCDVGNCDDTSATMAEKGFDGQKVFLLSARPKRSCYIAVGVENCDDMSATMAEKGKNFKKGRTYCLAGAPTDFSYNNNTHIPVFLCTTVQRI